MPGPTASDARFGPLERRLGRAICVATTGAALLAVGSAFADETRTYRGHTSQHVVREVHLHGRPPDYGPDYYRINIVASSSRITFLRVGIYYDCHYSAGGRIRIQSYGYWTSRFGSVRIDSGGHFSGHMEGSKQGEGNAHGELVYIKGERHGSKLTGTVREVDTTYTRVCKSDKFSFQAKAK